MRRKRTVPKLEGRALSRPHEASDEHITKTWFQPSALVFLLAVMTVGAAEPAPVGGSIATDSFAREIEELIRDEQQFHEAVLRSLSTDVTADLAGVDALTGGEVPDTAEMTKGVLVCASDVDPRARLIVKSCGQAGFRRTLSFKERAKVKVYKGGILITDDVIEVPGDNKEIYEVVRDPTWKEVGETVIATLSVEYQAAGVVDSDDVKLVVLKVESVQIKDEDEGSVIEATGEGYAYVEAVLVPDIDPGLPFSWQYRKRDSFGTFGSWTDISTTTQGFDFGFPNAGIYEFKAELLGSSATSAEFHNIEISFGSPHLWWLGGANAAASGYVSHSTVQVLGAEGGAFTWQITDYPARVDIRAPSGTWGDSVSGDNLPTIEIISISASPPSEMAVTVEVQYKGATSEDYIFVKTVEAVHVSNTDGVATAPPDNAYVWISQIRYDLFDQYGDPIPSAIPQNEDFTSADIRDWWSSSENWRQPSEDSVTMTEINDVISSEVAGRPNVPSCVVPGTNPLQEGQKVDHWTGKWYVGSTTTGSGLQVLSKTWQRYRGKARHE